MLLSYRQVHNNYLIRYNYLFSFKTVSISETGDNAFAVYPNLFTQTGDVYVDGTVEHVHFVTPDAGQDVFTGKYTSFILYQQKQDLKFFFGQWHFFIVDTYFFLCDVNNERLISKTFGDSFRFRCYCAS